MTSHSKPGWRRLTGKTHGTFEAIPSLRVPGKELHSADSSTRKASPKRPAQYADPTLFPGRRLDRRQQSNYSAVSGHSGHSGLEQLTMQSATGRFRTSGSVAGSTRMSHSSLPAVGLTNNRGYLPDASDPWGSARPLREDSPLTMLRRQAASTVANSEGDGKSGLSGGGIPLQSSISKVSRWQQANFLLPTQGRNNRPLSFDARETLFESPDSMESHESELQPPLDKELLFQQQLRKQQQQERELRQQQLQKKTRGRYTPPPLKVDNTLPTQQLQPPARLVGARHINPHRRPAETPAVSPTPETRPEPQLNKILWALVPDEHANNSEAGVSHLQPSRQDTSITADNNAGRFVTVTDLDAGSDSTRHVPDTPRNAPLTEQMLSGHNDVLPWSRDDRIFQWLAECDKETVSQSLPTHLPDIKYTFKHLKTAPAT